MSVEAKCIYCSCGCNKTPNAIDWGNNNIICYSACNAVHLCTYEKNSGGLHIQTLTAHKQLITSVHWIKRLDNAPENELIATSADHTASIWRSHESFFTLSHHLTGHSNVVRNATGLYLPKDGGQDLTVVTLSADSSIKIWNRKENEVLCTQTISLGNGFALDVKLSTLNNNNEVVMLVANDDAKLHIYIQDDQSLFIPAVKLVGHEDWIQSIDIVKESQNCLLIATASQDCHIRIWKVSPKLSEWNSIVLKVDSTTFQTTLGETYSVLLESVLSAHENWIYSIRWLQSTTNNQATSLQLLSASMDKTIIIWEHDTTSNIWLDKVRFGEVGGNTLGFFGSVFSPSGENVIAHGHQGAIHIWQLNKDEDSWQPGLSFGGHYSSVQDIDWDPDGEFLLSCSSDQTTRLHAPFVAGGSKNSWYEIARPQIHGYDMVCLTALDRFKYVSAGDEKVLRVFEAPRSFAETLEQLTKLDSSSYLKKNMAEGASVPSLGLSNKAVFSEDIIKSISIGEEDSQKHPKDRYPDYYYTPTLLTAPPTEETLIQNTLWPETQKLYGHPYEVFTVASNHAGTLIASACKASKLEHAGVILWSTATSRQVAYLMFHTLTVTQLEFSPNDEYLLSVSRDRMWALYQNFPDESSPYKLVANLDKKSGVHSRIIWSCSWTFDSLHFATSSRDKKVAVWTQNLQGDKPTEFSLCLKPLEVEDSATAVSFAPRLFNNKYLIAIGFENGSIALSLWCKSVGWNLLKKLDQTIAHHLNVNRLKFSPNPGEAGFKEKNSNVLQLASCSNDYHTKIYNIYLNSVS